MKEINLEDLLLPLGGVLGLSLLFGYASVILKKYTGINRTLTSIESTITKIEDTIDRTIDTIDRIENPYSKIEQKEYEDSFMYF